MRVAAVLGISGVGKSSLIAAVAHHVNLLHLTASGLIKAQLAQAQTSEQLRAGPVVNNQQLMLREFARRAAAAEQPLIVFDGHNLIDTPTGFVDIPDTVFAALNLNALVFIEDAPETIAGRREADRSRPRPLRSTGELAGQQERAKHMAARVAGELGIPFLVVRSGDVAGLRGVLEAL